MIGLKDLLPQERDVTAGPEEIEKLAHDIEERGLDYAIVIYDGVVLDGLKRIAAFRYLRRKEIPAVVTDEFDVMCLAIAKARPEPMTVPRAVEFVELTWKANRALYKHRKKMLGATKKAAQGPASGIPLRVILVEATGLTLGRIELAMRIVRRSLSDPVTAERLQEVKDGTLSLYAYQSWTRERELLETGEVASVEEVRTVMERGLRALGTTIETMGKFGNASVLTLSERQKIIDMLSVRVQALRKLNTTIRQGVDQETDRMMEEM
jgi:ParB-like nuclease family protein